MRRGVLVPAAAAILASACGAATTAQQAALVATAPPESRTLTVSSSASGTPRPPEVLLAVLEAHGDNAKGVLRNDTVAIVGLDGYARAKARFTPRAVPDVGSTPPEAGSQKRRPQLLTEAHVASGAVYFADAKGVVRRLTVGADAGVVATFPLKGGQQELSFAVSPDGTTFMGEIFTVPPLTTPACQDAGQCFSPDVAFTDDLYQGTGTVTTPLRHDQLPTVYDGHTGLAGWDGQGPLAVTQVPVLAGASYTSGGGLGEALSTIARLDDSGRPGLILGGSGCIAVDESPRGTVACSAQGVEVRSATGVSLYSVGLANLTPGFVSLSPDGDRVAVSFEAEPSPAATPGGAAQRTIVQSRDGTTVDLPPGFRPEGWIDTQTVVGIAGTDAQINGRQGPLKYVRLSQPKTLHDIGFSGSFVGVIQDGS